MYRIIEFNPTVFQEVNDIYGSILNLQRLYNIYITIDCSHAGCHMAQSAYGSDCPYYQHYCCIVSLCALMKQYNADNKHVRNSSRSFNEMQLQLNPFKKKKRRT